MHIASLEAHTALNTYNLWKLALLVFLRRDVGTRLSIERFDHKNDAVTARPQLQCSNCKRSATAPM